MSLMTEQSLLAAADRIVGAPLCVRSSPAGYLLTPFDWAQHRTEPFWVFARQRLPVSPTSVEATLTLIHLHGQWTGRRPQARSTRGNAAAWLVETLNKQGPLNFVDVRQQALQAGLAWDSVRRASQRIGVRKHKIDFRGPWVWSMEPEAGDPIGSLHVNPLALASAKG